TTAPVLSADGRRGFVATEIGNRLYGVDATTGAQLSLQELNGPPSSLRITHGAVGRLGLIDTLNNRVLLFELNGESPNPTGNFETRDGVYFTITQNILLSKDGRRAFVASPASNELLVIDTEKRTVTERVKVGEQPERIALVEAGEKSRIAVINIRSASVSLIEIGNDGSRVTGTVKLPGRDQSLLRLLSVQLSSDGLIGFVSDGVSKLLKFNAVSGEIVDSLAVGRDPVGLTLYERNGERR